VNHEFSYEITDELVRRAPRRLFYRTLIPRLATSVLLFGAIILLLQWRGGAELISGVFAGVALMLVLLLVAAAVSLEQRAGRYLGKLTDRRARCVISDEGLTVENAAAKSFVKWSVVERLVRDPDAWLLFIARQHYFVLPAEPLAGDVGTFIERRVAAAGGRLR
jgi:hypothetical protein